MRRFAFLRLAVKRLFSHPGFTSLQILSFSLSIGLCTCVPIFGDAVSVQILRQELGRRATTQSLPPTAVRFYSMPRPTEAMTLEEAEYAQEWISSLLERELRLPIVSRYAHSESPVYYLQAEPGDVRYRRQLLSPVQIALVQSVAEHIDIVAGAPFGSIPAEGVFAVWMHHTDAERLAIQVGDTFDLAIPFVKDAEHTPVRVAGLWEATDPLDRTFWSDVPERLLENRLLTTGDAYRTFVYPSQTQKTGYSLWYFILDDSYLRLDHTQRYINALNQVEREVMKHLPAGRMDYSPIRELEQARERKAALTAVLFRFSLPLVGLIAFFTASISAMAARSQTRELAIFSSRGASRWQSLALTCLETGLLIIVSLPLGLLLGLALARLLGHSQSFLYFVPRVPLRVRIGASDWRVLGATVAASGVARVVPSWLASGLGVVGVERMAARRRPRSWATTLLLLGLLAAITAYSYQRLQIRGSLGLVGWAPSDSAFDPLLLLAPSMFLLSTPLLMVQVYLLLAKGGGWIAGLLPSTVAYLGVVGQAREGGQNRLPVYMLTLCLGTGVFYASLARSADAWLVDQRRYQVGADLAFGLEVDRNTLGVAGKVPLDSRAALLPISDYEAIEGVARATAITELEALVVADRRLARVRLLGVDRVDLADVAYSRADFGGDSLGDLMNRLGGTLEGVLVPTELVETLQLREGDDLALELFVGRDTESVDLKVVGSFEHFATMYPRDALVLLCNRSYLQREAGGALPYDVWMRLDPTTAGADVLGQVMRLGVTPLLSGDLRAMLSRDRMRLERVGVFGMLSVCFLASALLSGLGLLIHNAALMASRSLRFAMWRAMGMRRGEIVAVVSIEYIVALVYGLFAGICIGVVAARLYVPFVPITDMPAHPVPPFIPLVDWRDAIALAMTMGVILLLLEGAIIWRAMRVRIFEALRMGMHE